MIGRGDVHEGGSSDQDPSGRGGLHVDAVVARAVRAIRSRLLRSIQDLGRVPLVRGDTDVRLFQKGLKLRLAQAPAPVRVDDRRALRQPLDGRPMVSRSE